MTVSVYNLKPVFQQALRPLLQSLCQWGVTPNQITISALLLSMIGGGLLWQAAISPSFLLLIPPVLLVRMALNALDGMLARESGQSSLTGEILNEAGDVVSDICLYLPLAVIFPEHVLGVALFVTLGVFSEFCGVLAKALMNVRRYDGPMGKSDRALVVSLLCLTTFFFPHAVSPFVQFVFITLNVLLGISCWNRLRAIRMFESDNRKGRLS
jgi:CDP-diacylglycerol--glycerol-3-phosphate 3-phosphatidyltransferase